MKQPWMHYDPSLEDFTWNDTGRTMMEELEARKKWEQAFYQPGMRGTQAEYSTGGRVPFG